MGSEVESRQGAISLSAVLPARDEEPNIGRALRDLVRVLSAERCDFEIIVVDDGSADRTAEAAQEVATRCGERVRVIRLSRREGYGAALRAGFRHAGKEWVFYTDSDNQFDVAQVPDFLAVADRHDFVIGYRATRSDSRLRRFLGGGYNALVRVLFGLRVRDVDCSFKLMRRAALAQLDLRSPGFLIDLELLVKARRAGLRIVERPVRHFPRRAGRSKVRVGHVLPTLWALVRVALRGGRF
ncbi:MAG: glycosyltransferase family 2 protein [Kiritimatiellae bacterium]|nr:glycosyltransferase family 2 protein [Kiritimatiellia bacterium]